MQKTIILTGVTGFVGANLARRLIHEGHRVHALVRPSYRDWRIQEIKKELQLHTVDFSDKDKLVKLFKEIHPDWIFHTAVYGAYSYQQDIDQTVQTNVVGLSNLIQAGLASGFESFVNTGSSSEYGYKDHAPTESEFIDPNSYYAVTKAAATYFCRFTATQNKVHIPTLRLYSVYGPYEEPTRLLPTLVRFALEQKLPPLVNPTIARDYVYIDDVVEAYLRAANAKTQEYGPIYNVGTQVQTTLAELVQVATKTFKIKAKPEWGSMPDRSWDTSCWVSNTEKIQEVLRWKPKITVAQGVRKFGAWIKDHDGWYTIAKDGKHLENL